MLKICSKCKKEYPATIDYFFKDKYCPSGFRYWCKKCTRITTQERNQKPKFKNRRKKYEENPKVKKRRKELHLKRKYNMTTEQKKEKYLEQNGCCAICEQPVSFDKIHIDHDHKTNRNRDLLCVKCNLGIGLFDENPNLLIKAGIYLEKHNV